MTDGTSRIVKRFAELKAAGRRGLVTFVTAGDPDLETSAEILAGLAGAGADIIELGMPFTDPMADGPSIQLAGQRALKAGTSLVKVLDMVRGFRRSDSDTPVALMGYYNPIYAYGVERFVADAKEAGVDGLIIVDVPPEEDEELCLPALSAGLNFIRLATPTTDDKRLPAVLANTSGFLYYVAIAGITGTRSASADVVGKEIQRIRQATELPIAVGFGIKTPQQAAEIAGVADAAVVGSALVERIKVNLDDDGRAKPGLVEDLLSFVSELSTGVRSVTS